MIEQLHNVAAPLMVIFLYWKYKHAHRPEGISNSKKILMLILLVMSIIILSITFTELIRTHNMSSNGLDLLHAYGMKYGLLLIIIPFLWILLQALNQLQSRLMSIASFILILFGFAGLYYFVVSHPFCLNEWDVCVEADSKFGAMSILILLSLFLVMEIYGYIKSIVKYK